MDTTEQTPPEGAETSRGLSSATKIGLVVTLLGGAVASLLFFGSASEAFVYSKMVNEVMTAPAQFAGRELRVEGLLKPGTHKFREDPCEHRFTIEKEGKELPVAFPQCVVPDTFRDGMGISVVVRQAHRQGRQLPGQSSDPALPFQVRDAAAQEQRRDDAARRAGRPQRQLSAARSDRRVVDAVRRRRVHPCS